MMSKFHECSYFGRTTVSSLLIALLVWLLSAPIIPDTPFWRGPKSGSLNNCPKHTLVLTAHPDDECMFFAPTIISLASRGCNISALCLSTGKIRWFKPASPQLGALRDPHTLTISHKHTGNSAGLGARRKAELYASYVRLGIHPDAVHILDHPYVGVNLKEIDKHLNIF